MSRTSTRHKIEHDFCGTQTIVAGPEQQTRVQNYQTQSLPVESLKRRHLLISFAGVIRPARDDVERRRVSFVGCYIAFFGYRDGAATRRHDDGLHPGFLRRIAEQARALDMQFVHLARVVAIARNSAGQMIDLLNIFDGPGHVVCVGDGSFDRVNPETGEPLRNRSGHDANVLRAGFDELANKMGAKKASAARHQDSRGNFFYDRRVLLRARLTGHNLRGAFFWCLRHSRDLINHRGHREDQQMFIFSTKIAALPKK